MTKTDALKLIEGVIRPCNATYKKHREEAAERILEALLDAGFKPPARKKLMMQGDGIYYETVYDWEGDDDIY